ncbi:homocysteine S-methyltransferase family protein [Cognatishimia sp. SS12]|uniref:homocysteine S-methyltransferase family protein n=1 Tax=Cognatishimia sp. SS12 TaxID=2979465 RepID=UPI00232B99B6|nr:homocysteine S-methyltransferase family protein [Cognatishimia sp. SS12]MDC0738869.1 homocysteine S-methyltransferase family protein [Cognatishimia sp. SS12]
MTHATPLSSSPSWIAWTGMETDLIFNKGVDLPEFAAFPMVDTAEGRERLQAYYEALIGIGRDTGVGVILDTPTWMANPDRASAVGYGAEDLPRVTRDAVALVRGVADKHPDVSALISVQIGPQGDGYKPGMAAHDAAATYHRPQIQAAKDAGADVVSAYTLGASGEAIGIASEAARIGIPALISYTVETDGRLADGTALSEAVETLHAAAAPAAIMVNCAHPDHLAEALDGGAWESKLTGFVANASRQSHAELDACETLDDGDPEELSQQLAALKAGHSGLRILGGCCGTDLRHLRATAKRML